MVVDTAGRSAYTFTQQIWSTQTCTLYKRLSGHEKEIYALEYSPDGRMLVSGSGDNTVRVWDMEYMDTNTDVRVSVTDVPGEAVSSV